MAFTPSGNRPYAVPAGWEDNSIANNQRRGVPAGWEDNSLANRRGTTAGRSTLDPYRIAGMMSRGRARPGQVRAAEFLQNTQANELRQQDQQMQLVSGVTGMQQQGQQHAGVMSALDAFRRAEEAKRLAALSSTTPTAPAAPGAPAPPPDPFGGVNSAPSLPGVDGTDNSPAPSTGVGSLSFPGAPVPFAVRPLPGIDPSLANPSWEPLSNARKRAMVSAQPPKF